MSKISEVHVKLDMICSKCNDTKALIVDKSKGSIPTPVERNKDGKVIRTEPAYPIFMHNQFCYYHLKDTKIC